MRLRRRERYLAALLGLLHELAAVLEEIQPEEAAYLFLAMSGKRFRANWAPG
jgi:hypothetical protein